MLAWIALSAFVVLALALDLRGGGHATPSLRAAVLWSIAWTVAGLAFAIPLAIGWGDSMPVVAAWLGSVFGGADRLKTYTFAAPSDGKRTIRNVVKAQNPSEPAPFASTNWKTVWLDL